MSIEGVARPGFKISDCMIYCLRANLLSPTLLFFCNKLCAWDSFMPSLHLKDKAVTDLYAWFRYAELVWYGGRRRPSETSSHRICSKFLHKKIWVPSWSWIAIERRCVGMTQRTTQRTIQRTPSVLGRVKPVKLTHRSSLFPCVDRYPPPCTSSRFESRNGLHISFSCLAC